MGNFDFATAQMHELNWQRGYIRDNFEKEWGEWQQRKNTSRCGLSTEYFFDGDMALYNAFVDHIEGKLVLDIGCGSFPWIKDIFNARELWVIDPLAKHYDNIQVEMFGKTFFENMVIMPFPAEDQVYGMIDSIDGCIMCRNTIDHSDDPLSIIERIAEYAKKDSYLLFWSDIWHLLGEDGMHRNVTKSKEALKAIFKGFGFRLIHQSKLIRDSNELLEFGAIYVKE